MERVSKRGDGGRVGRQGRRRVSRGFVRINSCGAETNHAADERRDLLRRLAEIDIVGENC